MLPMGSVFIAAVYPGGNENFFNRRVDAASEKSSLA